MFFGLKRYLHKYFRIKRLSAFAEAYPDLSTLSVLDVGGTSGMWNFLKEQLLNGMKEDEKEEGCSL